MLKKTIQLILPIFILSFFTGFAMDFSPPTIHSIVSSHEAEEDMELNEDSCLQAVVTQFLAKGGILIRMDGETPPFQLERGDMVFPSCSGGNNRSQTLWGLLRNYDQAISLQIPHATRYGFDPYNGKANWTRTHHVQKNDEFIQWAGVVKSPKFGWNLFRHFLEKTEASIEDLALMTDYYDKNYFKPTQQSGVRRIYITFAKNVHVHLHRLNQTNPSLENVFVLFYPIEDVIATPLPEWETYPRSIKTYQELGAMLKRYLDFSQIL